MISEFAAAVVPTVGDEFATPEDWATRSRRLSMLALEYRLRSLAMVMQDLEQQGTGEDEAWLCAARAFGCGHNAAWFRSEYESGYHDWVDGRANAWHPGWVAAHLGADFDGDPDEVAQELDRWYRRTRNGTDRLERASLGPDGQRLPVSGNLYLGRPRLS